MQADVKQDLPRRRKQGLIIKELPDEVLVYDQDRDLAHCLNRSAAAIWQACDGHTAPGDIASSLAKQTGVSIGEEVVWLALESLGRDHLLEERVEWPAAIPRMTPPAAARTRSSRRAATGCSTASR